MRMSRLKKFVAKYQIQVYSLVLVIAVAILSYLTVFAFKSLSEKRAEKLQGITSPSFHASTGAVTSIVYDSVSWEEKKPKVYKVNVDLLSRVMSAASKLGFSGEPAEDAYRNQYAWRNRNNSLVYSIKANQVVFQGQIALDWTDENAIKVGVSDLFGIDTSSYSVDYQLDAGQQKWWEFGQRIEEKKLIIETKSVVFSVVTTDKGIVKKFRLYPIEIVDSSRVELYSFEEVQDSFEVLPKRVSASVYPAESCGTEGCYLDNMPDPSGNVKVSSAETVLYTNNLGEYPFLVPILKLSGKMTTTDGYTGEAEVLVDVVNWADL